MDGMELQIDISIANYQAGGNLRLSEHVSIKGGDFGTLAAILGRFHELLAAVKEAQDRNP
jgi:hypothetical protein